MRQFTAYNADETFETVLRNEFELMRKQFDRQVTSLKESIMKDKIEMSQLKAENMVEVEKLKAQNQTLTNRLFQTRYKNK